MSTEQQATREQTGIITLYYKSLLYYSSSFTSSSLLSPSSSLPSLEYDVHELNIESWFTGDSFSKSSLKHPQYPSIQPESVKLTKFDIFEGRFMVRVELEKSFIEIPISLKEIAEWQRRKESQFVVQETEREREEKEL